MLGFCADHAGMCVQSTEAVGPPAGNFELTIVGPHFLHRAVDDLLRLRRDLAGQDHVAGLVTKGYGQLKNTLMTSNRPLEDWIIHRTRSRSKATPTLNCRESAGQLFKSSDRCVQFN